MFDLRNVIIHSTSRCFVIVSHRRTSMLFGLIFYIFIVCKSTILLFGINIWNVVFARPPGLVIHSYRPTSQRGRIRELRSFTRTGVLSNTIITFILVFTGMSKTLYGAADSFWPRIIRNSIESRSSSTGRQELHRRFQVKFCEDKFFDRQSS